MKSFRLGFLTMLVITHQMLFAGAFYTNESSFLTAIQSGFYLEDFTNFVFASPLNGSQTSYQAPGGNGFGWTASANLGLYSANSAMSVNNAQDPLIITFTSNTVMVVGGIVAN